MQIHVDNKSDIYNVILLHLTFNFNEKCIKILLKTYVISILSSINFSVFLQIFSMYDVNPIYL